MAFTHRLVKDDDTYRITDYEISDLAGLSISLTELKAGKHTRGHSHASPEIYAFFSEAVIVLGDKSYGVTAGQMLVIKSDVFHRVHTAGKQPAQFASFFWGDRDSLNPNYEEPKPELPAA